MDSITVSMAAITTGITANLLSKCEDGAHSARHPRLLFLFLKEAKFLNHAFAKSSGRINQLAAINRMKGLKQIQKNTIASGVIAVAFVVLVAGAPAYASTSSSSSSSTAVASAGGVTASAGGAGAAAGSSSTDSGSSSSSSSSSAAAAGGVSSDSSSASGSGSSSASSGDSSSSSSSSSSASSGTSYNPPPATPAPSCAISLNVSAIQPGGSATLTWNSDNATQGSITGLGAVPPSGSATVYPGQTTTYSASFSGAGGSVSCSATVVVNNTPPPPAAPTCTLNASPSSIESGDSATLSWTSHNATSGSINNGIGSVDASGSLVVYPVWSTTYTATFSGPAGSVNCEAAVFVHSAPPPYHPAPYCSLSASPNSVHPGQSVRLSWTSENANYGSITGIGQVNGSGVEVVYPTHSTSYAATFYGYNGQSVNCYASVNVTQPTPIYHGGYRAPECTLRASDTFVNPGQPVTLYWTSEYTDWGTLTGVGSIPASGSRVVYPSQSTVYEASFSGSGGSINCFTTVNVASVAYVPPSQPPYVSLSSAPYTGLNLGPWGTLLYWTFLVLWCALAAYLVAVKRVQNKLFDYAMGVVYGRKNFKPAAQSAYAEPAGRAPLLADDGDGFILAQVKR